MTDIVRVKWNGDHGEEREMFATASLAKKSASELRAAGISSTVEKITLKKMGKKDLLAAIYNGDDEKFAEATETLKVVEGMKKPKDPVAAAKLKARQVANKHRGVRPVGVQAVAGSAKAGTENKSMVPEGATAAAEAAGNELKNNIDKAADQGVPGAEPVEQPVKAPVAKVAGPKKAAKAANAPQSEQVNKDVSDQAPKPENKGDLTTADLKKGGGIKL